MKVVYFYPFYFFLFSEIIFLLQRKIFVYLKIKIMKSVSNSVFTTPKRPFNFLFVASGYMLAKFLAKVNLTLEKLISN